MKDVYPGNSFSILDAFVVCDAQLEFFDLGRQPIERRYFTIGEASMPKKGFMISGIISPRVLDWFWLGRL